MGKAARLRLATCFDFLMLVLGIVIAVVSWGYGFGSFGRPGPGLYPFFIGAAIAVFALFILISELRSDTAKPALDTKGAVTLPLLGYVVVTLLAAFAFCKIMKLEGWWKPLAVSGGTALFIYLLFDYWLYIDLPRGILG